MKSKWHPLPLVVVGLVFGLILHYASVQVIDALQDDSKSLWSAIRPFVFGGGYLLWYLNRQSSEKESKDTKEVKNKRNSNSSHQRNKQQGKERNSEQGSHGAAATDLSIDTACQEIGIHPTHTHDQLKLHWRIICRQWHPDTGGSHALWIRKQYAYEMLLELAKEREGMH